MSSHQQILLTNDNIGQKLFIDSTNSNITLILNEQQNLQKQIDISSFNLVLFDLTDTYRLSVFLQSKKKSSTYVFQQYDTSLNILTINQVFVFQKLIYQQILNDNLLIRVQGAKSFYFFLFDKTQNVSTNKCFKQFKLKLHPQLSETEIKQIDLHISKQKYYYLGYFNEMQIQIALGNKIIKYVLSQQVKRNQNTTYCNIFKEHQLLNNVKSSFLIQINTNVFQIDEVTQVSLHDNEITNITSATYKVNLEALTLVNNQDEKKYTYKNSQQLIKTLQQFYQFGSKTVNIRDNQQDDQNQLKNKYSQKLLYNLDENGTHSFTIIVSQLIEVKISSQLIQQYQKIKIAHFLYISQNILILITEELLLLIIDFTNDIQIVKVQIHCFRNADNVSIVLNQYMTKYSSMDQLINNLIIYNQYKVLKIDDLYQIEEIFNYSNEDNLILQVNKYDDFVFIAQQQQLVRLNRNVHDSQLLVKNYQVKNIVFNVLSPNEIIALIDNDNFVYYAIQQENGEQTSNITEKQIKISINDNTMSNIFIIQDQIYLQNDKQQIYMLFSNTFLTHLTKQVQNCEYQKFKILQSISNSQQFYTQCVEQFKQFSNKTIFLIKQINNNSLNVEKIYQEDNINNLFLYIFIKIFNINLISKKQSIIPLSQFQSLLTKVLNYNHQFSSFNIHEIRDSSYFTEFKQFHNIQLQLEFEVKPYAQLPYYIKSTIITQNVQPLEHDTQSEQQINFFKSKEKVQTFTVGDDVVNDEDSDQQLKKIKKKKGIQIKMKSKDYNSIQNEQILNNLIKKDDNVESEHQEKQDIDCLYITEQPAKIDVKRIVQQVASDTNNQLKNQDQNDEWNTNW